MYILYIFIKSVVIAPAEGVGQPETVKFPERPVKAVIEPMAGL